MSTVAERGVTSGQGQVWRRGPRRHRPQSALYIQPAFQDKRVAAEAGAIAAEGARLRTHIGGHLVVAEPMLSLRIRGGLPMTVHETEGHHGR